MIYLIDDKKNRQEEFGWVKAYFDKYKNIIQPLYNIEDVSNIGEKLYKEENIILYHESFLDFTEKNTKAIDQIKKLETKAKENEKKLLVFFSGSLNARDLKDNIAYLPVGTMYKNLKVFIDKYQDGEINLKYLLFGANPEIEEEIQKLTEKSKQKSLESGAVDIQGENLFIRPSNGIKNEIQNAEEEILFHKVSDEDLLNKVHDWLEKKEYDSIFIPLCFGKTLSDYNGLRLATIIRCSKTKNQLKPIFIYGIVGANYLLSNEYFDILRTKNVFLVDHEKSSFKKIAEKKLEPLTMDELPKEISKLKLNIPQNYFDSHSIANEWGIYQLAKYGNIDIDDIEGFEKEKLNTLYFKYLEVINGLSSSEIQEIKEESKSYTIKLRGLKVLGKMELKN